MTREEIAPKLSQVVASVCEVPPWHFAKHPAPQFHVPFPFSFEYASRSDATPGLAYSQPGKAAAFSGGQTVRIRPQPDWTGASPLGEPKRSFRPQACIGPKGRSRKAVQAQAAYSGARNAKPFVGNAGSRKVAFGSKAR